LIAMLTAISFRLPAAREWITLKISVVAPIPTASVSVAKIVNSGVRNNVRIATLYALTNADYIVSRDEWKPLLLNGRLDFGRFCASS
jgi:hypothetical protein